MSPAMVREVLGAAVNAHRAGRREQAASGYRDVLRREPRNSDALRLLGVLTCQGGDFEAGLRLLRRAAKFHRGNLAVQMDLAGALSAAGRWRDAVAAYRVATRIAPQDATAWTGLGVAQLRALMARDAIVAFRRALGLGEDNLDAWIGLGNAHRNVGHFDAARAAYERAIALRPDLAEAHSNLGNVAAEMGDIDAAIVSHGRAIELMPRAAPFHRNLGGAYQTVRRFTDAKAAFQAAYALDPQDFETLRALGSVERELGRHESALDHLMAAHAKRPADPDCTLLACLTLKDLDRAPDSLRARIDEVPEPVLRADALATLSNALESLNHNTDARDAADSALVLEPLHPQATVVLARLERRQDGGPERARDRLLRLRRKRGGLDSAGNTVLGQCLDRLGDYPAAFAAFAAAKAAARGDLGKDVTDWQDHFMDRVRRYKAWYSADRAAAWSPVPDVDPRSEPIFFVGFPRSGTTLFEQILNSHPRLATTDEAQILGRVALMVPSVTGRAGEPPEVLDSLTTDHVIALRRHYLDEAWRHAGADPVTQRVVDKMPFNIVDLGFIRRLFPTAPIVVALRDPRDVVLSCFMQNFQINPALSHFLTLDGTADLYEAVMGLWRHYETAPGLKAISYRYEDLVADVAGVARRILEFIGEPWDDSVLAYREKGRDRFVSTPSYADVRTPVYTRAIGRWRSYEDQLAPVLPRLAPLVTAFGYEPDGGTQSNIARDGTSSGHVK